MTNTITMSALYGKLSKIGLKQDYIRENGLPSWWDEELNDKSVAVLEGAGYIANNLNLDLKSLLVPEEEVRFNPPPHTKFKQHNSNNKEHPHIAQALTSRVTELISYGTEINFTPIPTDVKEIRKEIITTHTTVNLKSLLEYCWNKGIIVGCFHNFPKKAKKFAGLIQWQGDRPVIILSSQHKHSARVTFDLAHELGHLALGHLEEGVLVDEEIEVNCHDDDEECQANQFATYLLLGDCDNCLKNKKFYNNKQLITHAKKKAQENPTVEVTSIILNNAWHNDNWGFANKALNTLDHETNGQKIINEYLADRLDWDKFNDESYEYLEKVLGV
ncbi:ImmA/IrrE family metallo-endopeptidase [Aphanothece sacrum]|uniref:IrrE N-terminal-like domain-containing protein n=1 Tax=Aphanothece sacrum FPU1 TaxID=1920663 RepID=A0A401ID26_APHSA|nr:ImmA/IrrE family metallo-endopeptidase [Aphanothece sacrum]GBF79203.1 hypothetical protein AsFPU1_0595 [Aphanothece sacrum FPU1]GBF86593.1 hypothetical protein AsFPU3_3664 [Aphanothece sacrum FPU3]